jgi:hypothetical protein
VFDSLPHINLPDRTALGVARLVLAHVPREHAIDLRIAEQRLRPLGVECVQRRFDCGDGNFFKSIVYCYYIGTGHAQVLWGVWGEESEL